MVERVDDGVIDAVEVTWDDGPGARIARVAQAPQPVASLLQTSSWLFLRAMAEGAAKRHDRNFNAEGFRFEAQRDPDDTPFEGVLVYDYYSRISCSEEAFDRLMTRFLGAVIAGAEAAGRPETSEATWEALRADAAVVEARVAGRAG